MAEAIEEPNNDMEEQPHGSQTLQSDSKVSEEQRYALIKAVKSENGAEDFVRSISQQLLLQNDSNWGDLLGAAPAALCCLGHCLVAATASPSISSLELPIENSLQSKTLRANLVHCSDLGRKAFIEAQSKMQRVNMITESICRPRGTIDKILRLIDNEKLARVDLQRQMDKMKSFSEECVQDASDVHDKFESWLQYAADIRLACVSAEDSLDSEKKRIINDIGVVQDRKDNKAKDIKRLTTEVSDLKTHVEVHQNAYTRASQALPTGWNALAQEYLGEFAEHSIALLSTFSQLRGFVKESIFQRQERQEPVDMYSNIALDPNEDLGYKIVARISKCLQNLCTSLTRNKEVPPHYGVDWNTLYGYHFTAGSFDRHGDSIDVILGVFKDERPSSYQMKDQATSPSSREGLHILDAAIGVAEEIRESKEAEKSLATSMKPRDPGKIKRWRKTITELCGQLDKLKEERDIAVKEYYNQMNRIKEQPSQKPQKAAKKWQSFEFARENLKATHEALLKSEELLSTKVKRDEEAKRRFDEMQLELAKLTNEDMSMKDMIGVLKKCIERLTEFQSHLNKLVQFFDGLNNFIDIIDRSHAKEFLAQVNNIVEIDAANEHETAEDRRAEKQYLADELYMDALQLRGHYLVAGELSSVYIDVSHKYIMPGVDEVDRLVVTSEEGNSQDIARAKAKAIQTYARNAQKQITEMASKRQAALRKELFDQEREFEEIGYMIDAQGSEISEPDWISMKESVQTEGSA